MTLKLDLAAMSPAEKLAAIETIWASFQDQPENVPWPDWHADVLNDRRQKLAAGETNLIAWEEAKRRLENLGK